MRFANPLILNWLWLTPLLWLALQLCLRRREQKTRAFIAEGLLDKVAHEFSPNRYRRRYLAILVTYIFLIVALARPQWGFVMERIKQEGLDIILAVDVSKSMMTADVKPNRLERTKLAIKDLLKKVKGDRVALMAFAGEAFVLCPLTVDYGGFAMSLEDLSINSVPAGGTNISKPIKEALKTFGAEQLKYKALVILTDGEEEQGDAIQAARQAKDKGIRVFTIGIGTKEGDLIRVPQEDGTMGFLKDSEGHFVKSRLNEELLQKIAYETSGAYVRSSGAEFGLDYLYTNELSKWTKRSLDEKMQKKYYEQYQWPLLAAVIALMFIL